MQHKVKSNFHSFHQNMIKYESSFHLSIMSITHLVQSGRGIERSTGQRQEELVLYLVMAQAFLIIDIYIHFLDFFLLLWIYFEVLATFRQIRTQNLICAHVKYCNSNTLIKQLCSYLQYNHASFGR